MSEKPTDTTRPGATSDPGASHPPPWEPDPELIAEGARLVRVLDEAGAGPAVAFWIWFRDVRGFRLILAGGPLSGRTGGAAGASTAERRVKWILSRDDSFDALDDGLVGVRSTDARVVTAVRSAVSTGPGIHGIRIRDNVLGGVRLQRAYIYRSE